MTEKQQRLIDLSLQVARGDPVSASELQEVDALIKEHLLWIIDNSMTLPVAVAMCMSRRREEART